MTFLSMQIRSADTTDTPTVEALWAELLTQSGFEDAP